MEVEYDTTVANNLIEIAYNCVQEEWGQWLESNFFARFKFQEYSMTINRLLKEFNRR